MLLFSQDKNRLRKHFIKDRVLFAYHLGDLDDFYFPDCQWIVDYRKRTQIEEALLVYRGLDTPSLLAFGATDGFADLVSEALPFLPSRFYCHYQDDSHAVLLSTYNETPLGTHLKMELGGKPQFVQNTNFVGDIVRLNRSHRKALMRLYASAYPDNYFTERMLDTGKYLGLVDGDNILAVAGVHVSSDEDNIAVLGNITTAVEHRGKKFGQLVTSRLVNELVEEGKVVTLNVKADNLPAIRCYENLGFIRRHTYQEGLFEAK